MSQCLDGSITQWLPRHGSCPHEPYIHSQFCGSFVPNVPSMTPWFVPPRTIHSLTILWCIHPPRHGSCPHEPYIHSPFCGSFVPNVLSMMPRHGSCPHEPYIHSQFCGSFIPDVPSQRHGSCPHEPYIHSQFCGSFVPNVPSMTPWFVPPRTIHSLTILWCIHLGRSIHDAMVPRHGSCPHEPYIYYSCARLSTPMISQVSPVNLFSSLIFDNYSAIV